MELEEMKLAWNDLSKRVEKQEILNQQMIEKMTKDQFQSNLKKIALPEYIGTIICYLGAAYLSVNVPKLEEPLIQFFGVISIALLLILPIISLQSIRGMRKINLSSHSYLETIQIFGQQKIRFLKLQKLNISLGLFLLVIGVPVLLALQGKSLNPTPLFWMLYFPLGVMFFLGFSYWVLKYYNRKLQATEKLLTEVNE
ncbi:hypothetical protein [Aquiflexum gelatinilyticum]|uniref:DUF3278 domain-containing protein n=1 Tax=Aquiflexum gelatinilyticum TaxID=2961943 RepID=A0A9X2PBH6_9BACT|nr:hypothetical protein [Aquiflexum gelatinilyticum]MCR9017007.1 hypothetical protein [Aquiflexum gelatinilyticum]